MPWKQLSNCWRILHISLISCEISLALTWYENCVLTDIIPHAPVATQVHNPARPAIRSPINASFKITDTKLDVPVVTLSTEDDNKPLEQLKLGFKKTIKWNKCRSEMSNQDKTDNLNYLIDLTFNSVNRLFVLSFKNEDDKKSF